MWRSRGYLPHFDRPGAVQMITFRLADALPQSKLAELAQKARGNAAAGHRSVEAWLDAGHGACHLKDPRLGTLVECTLLHWDGLRYCLLAWSVMPNHVHVLIETWPGHPLSEVVHGWKSFSSKEANRLLARTGRFWQPEYFDRVIRDEGHLLDAITYIHENPVKAGLMGDARHWPYSSAARAGETPALPAAAEADR